ncbi:flavodoxin [Thiohalocapsa sp. ML1]|uniref:flavodoxin n=1 Tax=Thiohalocapsa sp. ML1 TaxID=1431688 RepID=UPI0007320338|nr:flavodoxin [Thiohalocapsa sp. ML1]
MASIGIFFSSENGATAEIARLIQQRCLPVGAADLHDLEVAEATQVAAYDSLIFGTSTMGYGYPSVLEAFLPELDDVDFTHKTVALFGLGDQYGYPDELADALGLLYVELLRRGARIVGAWPTAGYSYSASQADLGDGSFCGLVLDQDNQAELTPHRLDAWIASILGDLLPGGDRPVPRGAAVATEHAV